MKTTWIIGITGALLLITSASLKVMHYPGANILIPFSVLFLIIFMIMWCTGTIKQSSSGKEKLFVVVLTLAVLVQLIGALFKIMHYPGANFPFIQTYFGFLFLLVPVALIYIFSEKDMQRRSGYSGLFITYMSLTGLFLLSRGLPFHILNGFAMPDRSLSEMSKTLRERNRHLYARASTDSAAVQKAEHLRKLSSDLVIYITNLKMAVVQNSDPQAAGLTEDKLSIMNLPQRADYDTPTAFLIGGHDGVEKKTGENSAADLKKRIDEYRTQVLGMFDNETRTQLDIQISLRTENCEDEENNSWEACNFLHKPVASVIMVLNELRSEVQVTENIALQEMLIRK